MKKGKDWYWDDQVEDFIKNLLGNPNNIIVNATCRNNKLLIDAVNNFSTEGSKVHLFLSFCVNALTKNFLPSNENHWVGIHLKKVEESIVGNYFDPMGYHINNDIKKVFDETLKIRVNTPKIKVQYTQEERNMEQELIALKGNTDDCGPMLSYLMSMSYHNKIEQVSNNLNSGASSLLGVILRTGYESKMLLNQIQEFISVINDIYKSELTNNHFQPPTSSNFSNLPNISSLGRDEESTNIVGKILLSKLSNLQKIQVAAEFARDTNYKINSYLNTKGMDCIKPSNIGGTTLLHQVIFIASGIAKPTKEETKAIGKFFKALQKRNEEALDKDLFNPDYPTMNPNPFNYTSTVKKAYIFEAKANFYYPSSIKKKKWYFTQDMKFYRDESSTTKTDYHMISTSLLIDKLKFQSQKIQALCKKYFRVLRDEYEARQFEDSSGDSEEDGSPAFDYKQHLREIDNIIKEGMGKNSLSDKVSPSGNNTRTFDHFRPDYGKISPGLNTYKEKIFNIKEEGKSSSTREKWDNFFNGENKLEALDCILKES